MIGISAIFMWGTTIGLFRSISEVFGPVGGPALIFTIVGMLAGLALGWPRISRFPRIYLWLGGLLFIAYETCMALSIGLAHNHEQALELGMINYLWPALTVVFAILARQQSASWFLLPAIALCIVGISWVIKGDSAWSLALLWQNMQSNPPAYALAFCAAALWPAYTVLTRRFGNGVNGVPLFMLTTAAALWLLYASGNGPALTMHAAGLVQVLVLGILMATAYSCWNHGIQHGNMTLIAILSYFTPILSAVFTSIWLDISPGIDFYYGVGMVTLGSIGCWWATRPT